MSLPIDKLKLQQAGPVGTVLDGELVALARSGDSSAFEALFTRYYDQMSSSPFVGNAAH